MRFPLVLFCSASFFFFPGKLKCQVELYLFDVLGFFCISGLSALLLLLSLFSCLVVLAFGLFCWTKRRGRQQPLGDSVGLPLSLYTSPSLSSPLSPLSLLYNVVVNDWLTCHHFINGTIHVAIIVILSIIISRMPDPNARQRTSAINFANNEFLMRCFVTAFVWRWVFCWVLSSWLPIPLRFAPLFSPTEMVEHKIDVSFSSWIFPHPLQFFSFLLKTTKHDWLLKGVGK